MPTVNQPVVVTCLTERTATGGKGGRGVRFTALQRKGQGWEARGVGRYSPVVLSNTVFWEFLVCSTCPAKVGYAQRL
jgi:hypothetical protein